MIKKSILIICLIVLATASATGQKAAIKHNIAYDALLTPNLSLELAIGKKWTLDTQLGINTFFYEKDATSPHYKEKKFSHWMIQPELRYWTCEKFNGWYIGSHIMGGQYNIGKIKVPFILSGQKDKMDQHRYEGWAAGFGISTGYQWYLSRRWNLELSLGLGYMYINYDKFPCATCGSKQDEGHTNYLGPTKAAISLIYIIK